MLIVNMIFLAGLFGTADYFTGRDWKHLGWPLRSIYAVAPLLMVSLGLYGFVFGGHHSLFGVGFGWALFRCLLGWSSFGGSVDIITRDQLKGELERNAVAVMFPLLSLWLHGFDFVWSAVGMYAFGIGATLIAVAYGYYVHEEKLDIGPQADIARGVLFGLIVGMLA